MIYIYFYLLVEFLFKSIYIVEVDLFVSLNDETRQ